jgi:hypothetical protein
MNKSSIKSIFLKGKLSNGYLSYSLVKNELREGLWQLSVRDFGFTVKENNTSLFVQMSCNLIKDLREENNIIECFNSVIACAKIDGKVNQKQVVYFDTIWFQITTPDKEVKIFFRNPFNEELIHNECEVFVTIILQRTL